LHIKTKKKKVGSTKLSLQLKSSLKSVEREKDYFIVTLKPFLMKNCFRFFSFLFLSLGASVEMEIDERLIISLLSEAARNVQKEDINDC
jgi:hypothetical protein